MTTEQWIEGKKAEGLDNWQIGCKLLDILVRRATGMSIDDLPDTPELDSYRHQCVDLVMVMNAEERLEELKEIQRELRENFMEIFN